MTLTQKETTLLNDLKSGEQLCIEKYNKGMQEACDPALRDLFSALSSAEQSHLATINRILGGEEVEAMPAPSAKSQTFSPAPSTCAADAKNKKFEEFCEKQKEDPRCNNADLISFLIFPESIAFFLIF